MASKACQLELKICNMHKLSSTTRLNRNKLSQVLRSRKKHATKDCPHPKGHKVCSLCFENSQIWKGCTVISFKCVNREGPHQATALWCKIRNAAAMKVKRDQMNASKLQPSHPFSQVPKYPLQENPGKTSQQIQIKITSIITYAMKEEGSYHNTSTH